MRHIRHVIIIIFTLFNIPLTEAQTSVVSRTVTDIDHNFYKTVVIGKYVWMAENLRTTTYNNGNKIPFVTGNAKWSSLVHDAYCWYDDSEKYSKIYGALYNWYAVNTGNLCPDGWHVPSDEEWKYLEGFVDSVYTTGDKTWDKTGLRGYNAGNQLKSKTGWRQGGNGSDAFGFSALPGGERLNGFNNMGGSNGYWWSCTEYDSVNAWYRSIIYSFDEVSRDIHPKKMGFSVRCIRDN
jgi:uncharacterized protein (TIGR02145 family)